MRIPAYCNVKFHSAYQARLLPGTDRRHTITDCELTKETLWVSRERVNATRRKAEPKVEVETHPLPE